MLRSGFRPIAALRQGGRLMVAGVPPHAHCEICGTPVEVGERRCGSSDCERRHAEAVKAKKRGMWMFIGLIAILLLLTQLTRLRA
jgi:predicted nucleic acid-binding Zn ribbon protein